MEFITWAFCRPTANCLSKLIFGSHAHPHIKIPWMLGATAPPSTRHCHGETELNYQSDKVVVQLA